jgi:hypothetical protein
MKDLPWLPWLLVAISIGAFWILRRRAPAVAYGLLGLVIGGLLGHHVARGTMVPQVVGQWGLVGMLAFGAFGLAAHKPTASPRFLLVATAGSLLVGLLVVGTTWTVMKQWTCVFYDPPTRRWCAGVDLFMGISGAVTLEAAAGAILVVILFGSSALRARTHVMSSGWRSPDW